MTHKADDMGSRISARHRDAVRPGRQTGPDPLDRPSPRRRGGCAAGRRSARSFEGATGWLNSDSLTLEGLRGRVVLVDFWTYTCVN